MERRGFLKGCVAAVAGLVVAPKIVEAAKGKQPSYDKETDELVRVINEGEWSGGEIISFGSDYFNDHDDFLDDIPFIEEEGGLKHKIKPFPFAGTGSAEECV